MQLENRTARVAKCLVRLFKPRVLGLYSQALAALGAACSNHGTTATRFHAGEETVRTCALDFGGLVCAFHDVSSCLLQKFREV
jgi:hypothetical protein